MRRRHLLAWGAAEAGALAGLAAPAFVRHARAADVPRFALGIASGQPTPAGVVLWTRLTGPGLPDAVDVAWELAEDEAFAHTVARGTARAEAPWAHSVHVELSGLEPARGYHYRFSALGQRSAAGRTRTAPAPDAPATLRAVLASCQRWDHGHWAAWRDAVEPAPDLVLFVGDYLYEYASPATGNLVRRHEGGKLRTLADYRARYAQYKSDPLLQAAHAAAPWLLVWDDHEVENDYANDRGTTAAGAELLQMRAAAYQAWWEHQPVPLAMRPVGPDARIWQRLDWGRLARLQLVDDRQYRDPQACLPAGRTGGSTTVDAAACPALFDPRRTLLGAAQEQWLAEGWSLDRPWNLLVQQTLMARLSWTATPDAQGHESGRYWTDGWDGYPAARERLLRTVAERRVPGMVALGGDVHAHCVAGLKTDFADGKAPFVGSEFCGAAISSRGLPQARYDEAMPLNPHLLYGRADQNGCVLLDIAERRVEATLTAVRDIADPASPVDVAARFVVEPGHPLPQRQ